MIYLGVCIGFGFWHYFPVRKITSKFYLASKIYIYSEYSENLSFMNFPVLLNNIILYTRNLFEFSFCLVDSFIRLRNGRLFVSFPLIFIVRLDTTWIIFHNIEK